MNPHINSELRAITYRIDAAIRNIYYAMSFLQDNHPAMANLKLSLEELGNVSPEQVGLSKNVLRKRNESNSISNSED